MTYLFVTVYKINVNLVTNVPMLNDFFFFLSFIFLFRRAPFLLFHKFDFSFLVQIYFWLLSLIYFFFSKICFYFFFALFIIWIFLFLFCLLLLCCFGKGPLALSDCQALWFVPHYSYFMRSRLWCMEQMDRQIK